MNNKQLLKTALLSALLISISILMVRGAIAIDRAGNAAPDSAAAQSPAPSAVTCKDALDLLAFADEQYISVWDGSSEIQMELEDYIKHVVAAEMPALFELEALKAQAVAARTFAYRHMLGMDKCKSGHTICTDSTCCQAFMSSDELMAYWGEDYHEYFEKISQAVLGTAQLVAASEGKPISALYHSNSGGRTENSEEVFAIALPYLVSVESLGEDGASSYRAECDLTHEEFVEKLNALFPEAKLSAAKLESQISVWGRTDSGRVQLVQIGSTVITGQQMRTALKLHSTNFSFEFTEKYIKIICIGYGHGVGMSQYGANAMAKSGATFDQILKHYYTGITIEKIAD